MSSPSRGALIVIEGLDRAGKSTQHARLSQHLESRGHRVKRMRFPDRSTPIGRSIDAYLKGESQHEDHVIHLLFSANRWEASASIRANIEEGFTVIIDRYYYSGIVYSAAKGRADLTLEWARQPEVGLPRPDLCLFLDITSEAAANRGGFGGEKYETSAMQKRVRGLFFELMKLPDGRDMITIDAGGDVEEVGAQIASQVDEAMGHPKMHKALESIPLWAQTPIVVN